MDCSGIMIKNWLIDEVNWSTNLDQDRIDRHQSLGQSERGREKRDVYYHDQISDQKVNQHADQ